MLNLTFDLGPLENPKRIHCIRDDLGPLKNPKRIRCIRDDLGPLENPKRIHCIKNDQTIVGKSRLVFVGIAYIGKICVFNDGEVGKVHFQ